GRLECGGGGPQRCGDGGLGDRGAAGGCVGRGGVVGAYVGHIGGAAVGVVAGRGLGQPGGSRGAPRPGHVGFGLLSLGGRGAVVLVVVEVAGHGDDVGVACRAGIGDLGAAQRVDVDLGGQFEQVRARVAGVAGGGAFLVAAGGDVALLVFLGAHAVGVECGVDAGDPPSPGRELRGGPGGRVVVGVPGVDGGLAHVAGRGGRGLPGLVHRGGDGGRLDTVVDG